MADSIEGRLPTFLILGAMKSGTSSLHGYLRRHPDISMSKIKETDFFLERDKDKDLEWYLGQFDPEKPVRGEASPNYTKRGMFPGVPERIHARIPHAKLVFSARDPISRIASDWMHNRSKGRETLPFSRAIRERSKYVDTSSYARQLAPYVELFGRANLLILDSQALDNDTDDVVRTVLEFVGATSDVHLDTSRRHHVSDVKTEPAFVHRQMRRRGIRDDGLVAKVVNRLPQRFLERRPVSRPPIEGRDLELLREQLRDDVADFRRLSGLPFDHWQV